MHKNIMIWEWFLPWQPNCPASLKRGTPKTANLDVRSTVIRGSTFAKPLRLTSVAKRFQPQARTPHVWLVQATAFTQTEQPLTQPFISLWEGLRHFDKMYVHYAQVSVHYYNRAAELPVCLNTSRRRIGAVTIKLHASKPLALNAKRLNSVSESF